MSTGKHLILFSNTKNKQKTPGFPNYCTLWTKIYCFTNSVIHSWVQTFEVTFIITMPGSVIFPLQNILSTCGYWEKSIEPTLLT